jgi:hypothetical protein
MIGAPTAYLEGYYRGHKVPPGVYTIVLKSGDKKVKSPCTILPNPNYQLSDKEYSDYDAYMTAMEKSLNEMHRSVNTIYDMRKQLEDVLKTMDKEEKGALYKQGKAFVSKMKDWDELMVQRKSKAYDDVENFPNKFTAEYLFLINQSESSLPRITESSRNRLEELNSQWETLSAAAKEITEIDIPNYNKQLWEAGIGAVRKRK